MRRDYLYWADLREHRQLGIHIVSGKGTGKSRFIGRCIAFNDLREYIPTVIIDPVGQLANNFIDQVIRLPEEDQDNYWRHIRYIDLGGRAGHIMPMPFYYRMGNEGHTEASHRILDFIERLDPNLDIAPIQGMNAIRYIGSPVGVILSAMGLQITEADNLLADIDGWNGRIQSLKERAKDPDIDRAVQFVTRDYVKSQASMFRTKIATFTIDPVNRTMFGASQWAIPWKKVEDDNLTVIIDISRPTDEYIKRAKLTWVFSSLLNYIMHRRPNHYPPFSIVIDELNELYRTGDEKFGQDIDRLIHTLARNFNVWLTLAHQEMSQFDEQTQKVLMTMGTQVIGKTDDPEAARDYAHRFDEYAPHWTKDTTPIYGHESWEGISTPVEVGERSTFYTADEQERMEMYKYMRLQPLEFFVKMPEASYLRRLKVESEHVRHDIYPDRIEEKKDELMRTHGLPIADVEQEVAARLSDTLSVYEKPQRNDIQTPSRIKEEDDAFA